MRHHVESRAIADVCLGFLAQWHSSAKFSNFLFVAAGHRIERDVAGLARGIDFFGWSFVDNANRAARKRAVLARTAIFSASWSFRACAPARVRHCFFSAAVA